MYIFRGPNSILRYLKAVLDPKYLYVQAIVLLLVKVLY
jgi:hypothetical protein